MNERSSVIAAARGDGMTMVRANGISIHVEQLAPGGPAPHAVRTAGSDTPAAARTMVMIHGMASDTLASWYFTVAKPFADAGFRVVMYDLRGHGHSERPPEGYALDDFVDDLAALLVALGITEPVHLLGNSFGGTIAFTYAIRHPERVASIVAVESSPPTEAWFERVARRLGNAAAYRPQEHAMAEISAVLDERAGRQARAVRDVLAATSLVRDVPASRLPTEKEIAAIDCPVLCVYGGASAVVELVSLIRRLLPQASIVTVPDQRHSILIDQPHTVGDLILAWLREDCGIEVGRPGMADPSQSCRPIQPYSAATAD